MNTFTRRLVPAAALASVVLVLALTGCSTGSPSTVSSGSTTNTSSTASLTPSAEPVTPTQSSPEVASYRSPRCLTSQLRGKLIDDGGGAAGSFEEAIRFTNVGKTACTLQGWPGVSFVGHGNGTQIGTPAQQNRASLHATVTIGAGKTAIAPLRITDALNFPASTCKPTPTDGFRVYPPGERYSLFVKQAGFTGCADKKDIVLTISAVRPSK
jgi:hypothetical protein